MPAWLTSSFFHPEFVLPGAALVAIPIAIHLINRMRFRRVKWAAMEFLLQSQQRNRRRLLLEQLLLLLLRTALVLGLVALVARPILDPGQWSLFQGRKTHHLILLDDSGSMRDRWEETSGFAGGLEIIRKIAAEGERRPGSQNLTLMLLSNPDQPLFTLRTLDPAFVVELRRKLQNLECSHRSLDLAAGLKAAQRQLAEQPGAARNLHFISDFRLRDWDEAATVADTLREMHAAGVALNFVKTVPERHANLGVTELSGSVQVAAANVPLRLKVGLRNYGDQVARNVRLTILVDGRQLPAAVVAPELEAGAETFREFDVRFPTVGPHEVRAVLPSDALEQDNERFLALSIPETNPVLIIDGEPDAAESSYLLDALAPAPGITGFAPLIESPDYLRRHPLDKFQCVFAINVAELPDDARRNLEDFVAGGGGLAWFLGDRVRPAQYNEQLYRSGQGVFPARLGAIAELAVDDTNPGPDLTFTAHPLFKIFAGEDNGFVEIVKVSRYFAVESGWSPPPGVRVLASLRNKAPLFLEQRLGNGTVVACLTSCGPSWNNWPLNPSYVVTQLDLEKYIARRENSQDHRIVGDPIQIVLDAAQFSPVVEIRRADGATEKLTAVIAPAKTQPAAASGNPAASAGRPTPAAQFADEYRNTDSPGVYAIVRKRLDGGEDTLRYAYNVPESESELNLTTDDQIKSRLGPDTPVQIQQVGNFSWIHGEESGQEIQDAVLYFLLACLVFEQVLALKLSYHPRLAGARS